MKDNELVAANNQITPWTMLDKVLSGGANMDQIEKFMDLAERYDKMESRKAYIAALAAFKVEQPKITKDKKGHGSTYASLANITDNICPVLAAHGLSISWKTSQEKNIKVTCTMTHSSGHSESTSLEAGPDGSGKKNSIQAIGSTVAYLERYTFCALVGVASHDMDNDAARKVQDFISDAQLNELKSLISENITDETYTQRMLKYLRCESLETIGKAQFSTAITSTKNAIIKENNDKNK